MHKNLKSELSKKAFIVACFLIADSTGSVALGPAALASLQLLPCVDIVMYFIISRENWSYQWYYWFDTSCHVDLSHCNWFVGVMWKSLEREARETFK